jgi:hypothetical protein
MLGFTFVDAKRLGDQLQFASFPENWHRNTGERVIDLTHSWIFDHNPFVIRDGTPDRTVDLWAQPWPGQHPSVLQYARKPIYFSQAERTCSIFGHAAYLRHPRLYRFEELPRLEKRIVLHTTGANYLLSAPPTTSMGEDRQRVLPEEILDHVRKKYRGYEIIQVGSRDDVDAQVIDRRGISDMWEVAKIIAQASIFIGVDSGPYWIAACYPEIFRKKVLVQYPPEYLRTDFVPMHILKQHVHWHDASCYYYNRSTEDAGVTYSYLKL